MSDVQRHKMLRSRQPSFLIGEDSLRYNLCSILKSAKHKNVNYSVTCNRVVHVRHRLWRDMGRSAYRQGTARWMRSDTPD